MSQPDPTYNGLTYRLRHAQTDEVRDFQTIKMALDFFLTDHKAPWLFEEVDPNTGVVQVQGELQNFRCWFGSNNGIPGLLEFMNHYGYRWTADVDTIVQDGMSFKDVNDPGRFIKFPHPETDSQP